MDETTNTQGSLLDNIVNLISGKQAVQVNTNVTIDPHVYVDIALMVGAILFMIIITVVIVRSVKK